MPCLSYTLHCTPYTENKKYFLCFFFISRRAYIYVYLPPPARVRTLSIYTRSLHCAYAYTPPTRRKASKRRQAIHAKPTRRQAIHCACAYTRVARHIPKLTLIAATPHRLWDPGKEYHHHPPFR